MTELECAAQETAALLLAKGLTVSLAESCTGGMIAAALVGCPGVSDVFLEGCVSYSNAAKMRTLQVKEETLQKEGAVSAQCALEMVQGICHYSHSDTGLSVTGIAGPGGGTREKPVGLVYMGASCKGRERVEYRVFAGDRQAVRTQAAVFALRMLNSMLSEQGE